MHVLLARALLARALLARPALVLGQDSSPGKRTGLHRGAEVNIFAIPKVVS